MSDKLHIAARAEQDLNSYQAKEGLGPKIAKTGINEMVDKEFRIQRDSELAGKLAPQAVTACPFPKTTVAVGTTVVVHEANEKVINKAVVATKVAFQIWRDLSPAERGVYLQKIAVLITETQSEFARLEPLPTGKAILSYFDVKSAVDTFSYFSQASWDMQGSSSLNTPGHLNLTANQPYDMIRPSSRGMYHLGFCPRDCSNIGGL
ncbi:uncharacterized protein ATNIH1004_008825 [Aspergillus tanneri]|uniref:Aldehyde dehydrogenase domain-containing protein n=1 Tax=Aspergillus tanneri TaxID=1220188 RepID=A0A5M9MJM6_9EURO|nr:uncharacterized protein ATNIH1004_008825 [Aspergillus tanneri]KAA8644619.1 hypothetical protein ATNIH1004_008825 [Aspergillus tanneri]